MRDKVITLFNKNHIVITNTELNSSPSSEENYYTEFIDDPEKVLNYMRGIGSWVPTQTKIIEKKSPLGFYYTKKETIKGHYEYKNSKRESTQKLKIAYNKYLFYIGKNIYTIIYPTSYNDNKISQDLRPWEIVDSGMEDHYISDLQKSLEDLFPILSKVTQKEHIHKYSWYRQKELYDQEPKFDPWDFNDWKCKLFTDIFGNPKGPRHMTNDEKILSHGFDLKTSFRK